ncbi:bacterio-opsin activator domain-containing protein [Halobaculum sp. P14]|uniref:bacterio-opsin activator domain-containing protein n=1 Tax=Halobaculum sp. P14 TaxID=3421638 RepID=UPI003EB88468
MPDQTLPRILLVEDNPGDARYIEELLADAAEFTERPFDHDDLLDARPAGAGDGEMFVHETRLEDGVDRFRTEPFDVVLLDLNLPDSTGIETLRTLHRRTGPVPVVVLTGVSDHEVGVEALREGAEEYLVKDEINPNLLARTVYHAIERKAHERTLKRYETLIEESTDVNAVIDLDGTVSYVTPSVEHVLGYPQDALVGENTFEYVHPDDRAVLRAEFSSLTDDSTYRASAEFRFRHADGSWVDLEARGRNLLDEPAIGGLVVYTHDVTERKAYERRLELQRERLAALNQLNGVVHGVTEAVIDRSTRQEIEQIVCERLAESASYEFAWIAEHDRTTRSVTVRAEAGTGDYLDEVSLSMDPDDETGQGPTPRALRTGELQTVRDAASDESYAPWREAADEYGFRSSAAIPISHEDTVYGVLNVYADREDAFRDEERTVLGHLGEIVGHAIAAAERKQALMSDSTVELEVRVPDVFDALGVEASSAETLTFERAVPVDDDEFLIYGVAPEHATSVLESLTEQSAYWTDFDVVSETLDDVRFELRTADEPVMSRVAEHGGSVEQMVIEDGTLRMVVHLPPDVAVRAVIETIRDRYPEAEPVARRQLTDRSGENQQLKEAWSEELTDRQRTVLETAYFAGYFEWPRQANGEEVAESLGISSATFSQHLRAAENTIFGGLLSDGDDRNDRNGRNAQNG